MLSASECMKCLKCLKCLIIMLKMLQHAENATKCFKRLKCLLQMLDISSRRTPEDDVSCASSIAILVEFGYPISSDSVCRAISDAALRRLPQSAKVTSSHPLTRSNTCCLPKLTTLPATTSTQQRGRPHSEPTL